MLAIEKGEWLKEKKKLKEEIKELDGKVDKLVTKSMLLRMHVFVWYVYL